MDDELFMDEIKNKFHLYSSQVEDEIDHMYHSYKEKNKNSYIITINGFVQNEICQNENLLPKTKT